MNILITSAGRRVSLLRSFQNELKKVNTQGKVYASDFDPMMSAACQVADCYFKTLKLDDPHYIDDLIKICVQNNISLVIPTIDTELLLLAENKYEFEKHNIKVVVSNVAFIEICRNKRLSNKFFETNNIRTAKEFTKENYRFPIFIKPVDGSRSKDNFIINSEEEFQNYHFQNEKLMFLEYLDHEDYDEYSCDLYYNLDHILICAVPRKRIEVREGEVYKALTCNNNLINIIRKQLSRIEGAVGCLTAQFFMHKTDFTKIYGIEINPRFGGGYPLTYLSGANYSKWIVDEYLLDIPIEEYFNNWEDNLLMIRYDDEVLVHGYRS